MYKALLTAYANLSGNCENKLLEKWAHLRFCQPNTAVTGCPGIKCAFKTLW